MSNYMAWKMWDEIIYPFLNIMAVIAFLSLHAGIKVKPC